MIPHAAWHQLLGIDLVVPHWHVVSDRELAHISSLYKFRNLSQFRADLEFFLHNYKPVCLQDIINHLDGSAPLPKRCFLPTFDDGFREIHETVAPVLIGYGIPAIFFIVASTIDNRELGYPQKKSLLIQMLNSMKDSPAKSEVELILNNRGINGPDISSRIKSIYYRQRHILDDIGAKLDFDFSEYLLSTRPYMTTEQITDLINKGFDIGAHSIDHPLFPELSVDEQLFQTRESMRWISNRFRYDCQSFAFPYRDTEISGEFFHKAFSDGRLKVSFGIGGILRGHFSRHLPRFSMERTDSPANLILARQFGRAALQRSFLGKTTPFPMPTPVSR